MKTERLLLRPLLAAVFAFTPACGDDTPEPDAGAPDAAAQDATAGDATILPDAGEAPNFRVHYHRPDRDYEGASLNVSGDLTASGVASSGTDAFGAYFDLRLPQSAQSVSLQFAKSGAPEPAAPFTVVLSAATDGVWWFHGGEAPLYGAPPALPGPDQVVVYYVRGDGLYGGWGLHIWGDVANETGWSTPLANSGTDPELGAYFVIDLKPSAERVNLIIHGNTPETLDTKDPGPDMGFDISELGDLVWVRSGSTQVFPFPVGIPLFSIDGARGHFLSSEFVAWSPSGDVASVELRHSLEADIQVDGSDIVGGTVIPLAHEATGLPSSLGDRFPHLRSRGAYRLPESARAELGAVLKGQLVLVARDEDGAAVDATLVQIPGVLDELYFYEGPLGATFAGRVPTLTVWAPTAESVRLVRFDGNLAEVESLPMTASSSGTFTITGPEDWYGLYYQYELRVYHPISGRIETLRTTDPYSVSLSVNSQHTQIVDLENDASLRPTGWDALVKPAVEAPEDIVIYEAHIRDFSAFDPLVPSEHRGKYKAFTYDGASGRALSNGMAHLRALAEAGLTHLHLLPMFDIATINEDPAMRVELTDGFDILCAMNSAVPADLCTAHGTTAIGAVLGSLDPSTEAAQAIVTHMRQLDPFNWGYDPFHFNAPEGSYATASNGSPRILELREMVQSLGNLGLSVVMDVVYNHTNQSGLGDKSVLDKVVPGYYHRQNPDSGFVERSTCCDNTATEHKMMERLMIDSLVLWAKHYKIDAFRFDLMGHHMKSNMEKALAAVQSLTLEDDGVDGRRIYFYGEGWNFGEVANGARGENAIQLNMAGTGIGTFNDRLRDATRGGGPFDAVADLRRNQGFVNGLFHDKNELAPGGEADRTKLLVAGDQIKVGMAGNLRSFRLVNRAGSVVTGNLVSYGGSPTGYTSDPQEVITYVSKHDNQTLFDINAYKAKTGTPMTERVRMQNLAVSIAALGQGIPFFHMGVDLLRSKSMERDSYDSGDWFNRVDFTQETNNWNVGLPNAEKDRANWPIIRNVISDASIAPSTVHIAAAHAHMQEMLAVRQSSVLFRLRTEEQVKSRVHFLNTGADQVPGLIAMSITDGTCAGDDLDPEHEAILVLVNATPAEQSLVVADASDFELHPVLESAADARTQEARFEANETRFVVPPRTSAVFVKPQGKIQGDGLPCNTL